MNGFEQVAFGWQCLLGSFRACRTPAVWGPWVALFALQAAAILAFWFGAHPWVSWFVAPLVRAVEDDAALRYPELFRRLPLLARDSGLVLGALALPVLAGVSTRLFERRFRHAPAAPRAAWAGGLSRSGALLLAALPVTATAVGLHVLLQSLHLVRLSGAARALAPVAADGALLLVRVACAYAVALVVLGGRSGPRALAGIPGTWPAGFVPAAVALLLLAPAGALAGGLVTAAEAAAERGAPEWIAAAVLVRAAAGAGLAMVASGAVTLAWMGGVDDGREGA